MTRHLEARGLDVVAVSLDVVANFRGAGLDAASQPKSTDLSGIAKGE